MDRSPDQDRLDRSLPGESPACRAVHRGVAALAALIGLAVLAYFVRNDFPFAHDDAFISFVYADNLAAGDGLVFNRGERVWGYTSPAQTLLLALCAFLGMDTVSTAPALAVMWISITAVVVYRLARELLPCGFAACAALYVLTWGVGYEFLGLESNLLVLLQCLFLRAVVTRRAAPAALLGSLSCLTRPDSVLLVVPLLLAGRETRRVQNLGLFAAPGIAWLAFALAYYGEIVPNSLHAKAQLVSPIDFFTHAVGWIASFSLTRTPSPVGGWSQNVPETARYVIVVLLTALSLANLRNSRVRHRPALLYALVVYPWVAIGAYTALGAPSGHTWEIYSAHFFFALSFCVGAFGLLERPRAGSAEGAPARAGGWAVARAAALALALFIAGRNAWQSFSFLEQNRTSFWGGERHSTYLAISSWLNRNLEAGTSVAMAEVGTLAYYTDLVIVDLGGIVTKGYDSEERQSADAMLRRFQPEYALLSGSLARLRCAGGPLYRQVHYFPSDGFQDFSLLKRQ